MVQCQWFLCLIILPLKSIKFKNISKVSLKIADIISNEHTRRNKNETHTDYNDSDSHFRHEC
jgi:hypothetical protein